MSFLERVDVSATTGNFLVNLFSYYVEHYWILRLIRALWLTLFWWEKVKMMMLMIMSYMTVNFWPISYCVLPLLGSHDPNFIGSTRNSSLWSFFSAQPNKCCKYGICIICQREYFCYSYFSFLRFLINAIRFMLS